MSVLSFEPGDMFVSSIMCRLIEAPETKWQQTLEWVAGTEGTITDIEELANDIQGFWSRMLIEEAEYFELRISTWLPDSHPYDPTAFYVDGGVVQGEYTSIANAAPLDTCMLIRKQPISGRIGSLPMRGVIRQGDYTALASGRSFIDLAAQEVRMEAAVADSGLGTHIGVEDATLALAMIGTTGLARVVTELSVQGVQLVKTKHKWFNHAP